MALNYLEPLRNRSIIQGTGHIFRVSRHSTCCISYWWESFRLPPWFKYRQTDRQAPNRVQTERLIRKCCSTSVDLGGFPVRILIQFVLDKQQKSITKRFSGALGNKIAGHKKNLLLLRQTLSENRNHTIQQQQQEQRQRQQPFFGNRLEQCRGLCFAGCLNRYCVYAVYEVSQAFFVSVVVESWHWAT